MRKSPADNFDAGRKKEGTGTAPAGPTGGASGGNNKAMFANGKLGANKETGKKAPRGIIAYAKK